MTFGQRGIEIFSSNQCDARSQFIVGGLDGDGGFDASAKKVS